MAIGMVIFGFVAGIFTLVASGKLLSKAPASWIQRWLKPRRGQVDQRYLQRASSAITARYHNSLLLPLFPVIITSLMMFVLFFWGFWGGTAPSALPFLGLGVALVVGYPFFVHPRLGDFRRKVSSLAARQLVRRAKPEEAGAILIPASQHADPVVRLAATEGLRELGTNSGIAALKKLSEDKDSNVAAEARDALADLLPVLKGTLILSVRTMDTYVEEHRFLGKQLSSRKAGEAEKAIEKLDEITKQIDEIVFSQLSLRRAYPDVFCEDCYSRAEDLRYEEWDWVRCKQCKEVHGLRTGVQKVIGQIGGNAASISEKGAFENGILRVNLWDAQTHKARYGEVDVLEVIGGESINYDWAVSAVIEKMHNQNRGPMNMISVKLVANPVLEVNTLHLLRTLDPGVMGE